MEYAAQLRILFPQLKGPQYVIDLPKISVMDWSKDFKTSWIGTTSLFEETILVLLLHDPR